MHMRQILHFVFLLFFANVGGAIAGRDKFNRGNHVLGFWIFEGSAGAMNLPARRNTYVRLLQAEQI